jgi:hypothetical protein
MNVCVERGRGYVPAEKREPEALPINAILLDADFSPVERVNFQVEPAVDGRQRLVLEVWTERTARGRCRFPGTSPPHSFADLVLIGRVEDWRGAHMSPSAPASSNGANEFRVRRSPVCFA